MPIYEYDCKECGEENFSLLVLRSDVAVRCPSCNSADVEKKISVSNFHLKGGGWYKTDYRGGGK